VLKGSVSQTLRTLNRLWQILNTILTMAKVLGTL
jgi:hypothetical protein